MANWDAHALGVSRNVILSESVPGTDPDWDDAS